MGREIEFRSRFVGRRLDHKPQPAELMDLTTFMHGGPDPLVACEACGLVVRKESHAASYATDYYDRDLLDHLYPRYLDAFRRKCANYTELLPPRAEVLEVGSHLGAFLQAAEEWNARPTGLDIGDCTSTFSTHRGLRVKRETIEETSLRRQSMDAIFVWNCFEQLEYPADTLRAAHGLLKPHGLLVLRIPNFGFYERWCAQTRAAARRALAYNNLLGFPYLFGYTPSALNRLATQNGFQPVAGFDTSVITIPFPDLTQQVKREFTAVHRLWSQGIPRNPAALTGPWIEIVCRRQSEKVL
jgi:SAM-dependent methyltransferase